MTNNDFFNLLNTLTMSDTKKNWKKPATKPAEEKTSNPFEGHFLGGANIVQPKDSVFIEISLDFDELYSLIENKMGDLEAGASFRTKEDKFFVKIKGIPLREPTEYKSHFLVIDYYKKP